LKDHIAAIVADSGQGPISEAHLGRTDVVSAFTPFAESLKNLRDIKANDRAEFGTDSGPFVLHNRGVKTAREVEFSLPNVRTQRLRD